MEYIDSKKIALLLKCARNLSIRVCRAKLTKIQITSNRPVIDENCFLFRLSIQIIVLKGK